MLRWAFASILAAMCSVPVLAQLQIQPSTRPKPAEAREVMLQDKLRYLCKQLELNEQQWQHVEGLFTLLDAEVNLTREEMVERLLEIQRMIAARDNAKAAGDTKQFDELTERLKELMVRPTAEKHFMDGLMPVLTEAQKAKLPELLKQLAGVTDLSLKPVQVLRTARALKLNPDQLRRLEQIEKDFRQAIGEAGELDAARRTAMVDKIVRDVAAVLDAEQRAQFEKEIDRLRPPPPTTRPGDIRVGVPASTQPGPHP
jgi:Spy/CpxP family protein refolding chaperone